MRRLNQRFLDDLRSGELAFFLTQVLNKSNMLSLEIRDSYVNIYYRGGNLLRITQKKNGYAFHFNERYCLNKNDDSSYERLHSLDVNSAAAYAESFPIMVQEMNSWFAANPKPEREYQHNLLISNHSIIDIEYQVKNKMRFDMIAVQDGKLIVVENKFGLGAVSGNAGLAKHYEDICAVLGKKELYSELVSSVVSISRAKVQLGLSTFSIEEKDIVSNEVLFLLANYNLNSGTVKNEAAKMTYTIPAKILLLGKNDHLIDWGKSENLFAYGS